MKPSKWWCPHGILAAHTVNGLVGDTPECNRHQRTSNVEHGHRACDDSLDISCCYSSKRSLKPPTWLLDRLISPLS